MKYVRFTGSTPYKHTSYIQEQVFEDTVTIEEIKQASKSFAIDNANYHSWMFLREGVSEEELNEAYQDYISTCIDRSSWQFIEENED